MTGKLENINVNNLPCIVHFIVNKNYKHFVVLYEINHKKKKVTIMDPAKGKVTIKFSEFNLLTSNNYLFLKPIKKLPIMHKKNILTKNIKINLKRNKLTYIFIILLTTIYFIENIVFSYTFKYFLEYSININITEHILIIFITLLSIFIFKNINLVIRNIMVTKWLTILDNDTTTNTYKQILLLPYLYYKNRTTGEVISRFKDLNTTRTYIANLITTVLTDIFCIVIFLSIMFKYNTILTLISLGTYIILFILTILLTPKKKKHIKQLSKQEDIINTYLIEGVSNVDTIKGSHLEKRLIDKFNIKYKNLLESIYKYSTFQELHNFIKNNINDLLQLLIYTIGSYLVIKNKLSLANLLIFETFSNYLINSFSNCLVLIENYPSYKISKDRVEELFMIDEEEFKNNYFYLSYNLTGNIILKNLNYKIGTKVLFENLNLEIKQGEKILLTGSSGSGKSTLMKMLLKYIETDYGTIKISGIDINHYHLENIRSNITYVTSNEFIFNDTIRNNITLYKDYSEEELEDIVKICSINDIIKDDSLGLDKRLEENGFNLSNGERQRIILARSLIKKTNIYIFDEALGQIDVVREKKILQSIFSKLKDKTIIVISHRSNNKKLFDRVLKLEERKIYDTKKVWRFNKNKNNNSFINYYPANIYIINDKLQGL